MAAMPLLSRWSEGWSAGSTTKMYAPMTHMQIDPVMAPISSSFLRPSWSTKNRSHTKVMTALTTPKRPVNKRTVLDWTPRLCDTISI